MLANWQTHFDSAQRERVRQLGLLTGLRYDKKRGFGPANFERALVLQRAIQARRPSRVLELGTGRGLGALAMASAARESGIEMEILSVDLVPPTAAQYWPIEIEGKATEQHASLDEIWSRHIAPDLRKCIHLRTGSTGEALPALVREGKKFDFIFIDAGHDLYSVVHDLSHSMVLLAENGAILMDDFAPMEDFGLGTCIALAHARNYFDHVETLTTEGVVYGGAVYPDAPRGMVYLAEMRERHPKLEKHKLLWWRIAGAILSRCYTTGMFPIAR